MYRLTTDGIIPSCYLNDTATMQDSQSLVRICP